MFVTSLGVNVLKTNETKTTMYYRIVSLFLILNIVLPSSAGKIYLFRCLNNRSILIFILMLIVYDIRLHSFYNAGIKSKTLQFFTLFCIKIYLIVDKDVLSEC